jgi:predicted  nucleic acid-binding Zn-ribbon protein
MAELIATRLEGLDVLADQIERATTVIARLKDDNSKLTTRLKELEGKLGAGEKQLAGRKLDEVLSELDLLRGIEKQWTTERKEIAHRIEDLVKKLEKIES